MRAFDSSRLRTRQLNRRTAQSSSYSKMHKPLAHKISRLFRMKNVIMCTFGTFCLLFVVIFLMMPSSSPSSEASSSPQSEAQQKLGALREKLPDSVQNLLAKKESLLDDISEVNKQLHDSDVYRKFKQMENDMSNKFGFGSQSNEDVSADSPPDIAADNSDGSEPRNERLDRIADIQSRLNLHRSSSQHRSSQGDARPEHAVKERFGIADDADAIPPLEKGPRHIDGALDGASEMAEVRERYRRHKKKGRRHAADDADIPPLDADVADKAAEPDLEANDKRGEQKEVKSERVVERTDADIWPTEALPDIVEIRAEMRDEFKYAWNQYKKCGFGHDSVHPIACTGDDGGFNMALTMIDSLDTMILMQQTDDDSDLKSEISDINEWIGANLQFQNRDVSTFETTIRIVGGLLAAFHLTNETLYFEKAHDLTDLLMTAFDDTTLPFATVSLDKNKAYHPQWAHGSLSTSEGATLQLEFNYLSHLTSDRTYAEKAQKAQDTIIEAMYAANPPLLRRWISTTTHRFTDKDISVGSRIDSAYEYFLKTPLQLRHSQGSEHVWKAWLHSASHIMELLSDRSVPNNYLILKQMRGDSDVKSFQFDHLNCFIGGAFALSSLAKDNPNPDLHLQWGKELTETCAAIYFHNKATGLAPEIVYFQNSDATKPDYEIHSMDHHSLLRPETVESIFYLWRITHEEKYRQWAYQIFKNFRSFGRVKTGGYSSINDVTAKQVSFQDNMESFFMAETMKYLYLTFCDDDVVDIRKNVFNTEAHPLPILS